MEDIFAGRLMSSPVETVGAEESMLDVAGRMLDRGIGSVVVVDGANRLEGILTATDFVRAAADDRSPAETTVEAYMSTDVITTTANDPIQDVADAMIEHDFHHVPVVDETEGVVGMITTTDLTAYVSTVRKPSPS